MLRKQAGFTLVELMVTMVVFTLTIVAAANIFTSLMGQFKMQSKIAETNIEGLIGLQMMKTDIEQAGFGLPWNIGDVTYQEAISATFPYDDPADSNDATANVPRPVVFGNNLTMGNASDVLVIKATSIGTNAAAQRWTYITNTGPTNNPPMIWTPDTLNDNPENGDNVTAIKVMSGTRPREIVGTGAAFSTAYNRDLGTFVDSYEPSAASYETHLLYGVNDGGVALRMPFNRADYYVRNPGAAKPSQCSQDAGTGVLYKAVVNHNGGGLTELPILDCVREMKVVFARDTDGDGDAETFGILPATLTAEEVRNQLKEVRVYILAHEGQRDPGYQTEEIIVARDPNFSGTCPAPNAGAIICFDANAANLRNFRWKVYTMLVKPFSTR